MFPTIVGIAMDKPIIVVESASPTPFDIVSGLGIESSVAKTVTSPATVPSSPSRGAADIIISSKNIPRSRRVISSWANAFNASASGDEFL